MLLKAAWGTFSETSSYLRLLHSEGIDVRFFRRRQYSRVGEAIVEIAERHRDRLGPQVTDFIEVDCRHGEEEIAFELLIEMLYEEEIESRQLCINDKSNGLWK